MSLPGPAIVGGRTICSNIAEYIIITFPNARSWQAPKSVRLVRRRGNVPKFGLWGLSAQKLVTNSSSKKIGRFRGCFSGFGKRKSKAGKAVPGTTHYGLRYGCGPDCGDLQGLRCRPPPVSCCKAIPVLFFHGGNTGSNPVGDAKILKLLTGIASLTSKQPGTLWGR